MHKHEHSGAMSPLKKDIIVISAASVIFAAVWIVTSRLEMPYAWLVAVLFLIPYFAVGGEILTDAARKLLHGELLDEDFLMSVASIGAIILGDYPEAVAVMLFYRIGECFEDYAVGRSRRSVFELMDLRPEFAYVESYGEMIKFRPESVRIGTVITVSPGEKVPLDGIIIDGESSLDTSALTGEAMPRAVHAGQEIFSGCINLSGVLRVKVTSSYSNSTVSKILALVEESIESKSEKEAFITRFSRYYTPIVVSCALLLALIPSVITGEWGEWLRRALIFLVISCPCALVISVPLSFFGGIGCASRNGILIKGSTYLEALSEISTVVMDKTGTVTEGSFSVIDVRPVGISSEDLITLAASAECFSSHPIAVSLRKACKKMPDSSYVTNVRELAGRGIEATVCGRRVLVGNSSLMLANGIEPSEEKSGSSIVHVAADGVYGGYIVIDDRIKPGAKEAVAELYRLGVVKTVMLTGDSESTGQAVAGALNVGAVYTELMPEDKVIAVNELLREKHKGLLAFIGDGINDAPVLTRADIGIAMGALGSDAAIEAADVVLMDDDIAKLPVSIKIARKTVSIAKQNIWGSLIIKFAILLLAALGAVSMWLAVFADVGVLILASANALRTLRYEK